MTAALIMALLGPVLAQSEQFATLRPFRKEFVSLA